ncbi:hypothetical protein NQ315_007034 [Exocentrus adspersus]|uniref:Hydroxylysine kinase n=1 Tax=Exocentrus adspersus TaxID=1586481 RepID=A0AAV8WCA9_9CUCU|nr:hypothetical protein NQ315_007034 [Exocentrus adspersus]
MEAGDILKPGVDIKPVISLEAISELISSLYGFKVLKITEINGYDDKNYHVIVDKDSKQINPNVGKVCEQGYVLKIVNSLDSKRSEFFDAQNALLLHLGKQGVLCPKPIPLKDGTYFTKTKLTSGEHIVRLLEFIGGSILQKIPCTPKIFRLAGEFVAKLDIALQDFHHPAYDTHQSLWMLKCTPELRQFIFAVTDESRKKTILEIINEFETRVLPLSDTFQSGLIHGDFNEQNIIVEEDDGEWKIKAVIDFGDSHLASYLFELAICMAYMMVQARDLDAGGYVLAGYSSVREVPDEEFRLLKVCIAARLCQSLVMGAYSSLKDPGNSYVLTTAANGWLLLEEMWKVPEAELLQRWKTIATTEKV